MNTGFLGPAVATAPTVYGIETQYVCCRTLKDILLVATAPTVYGIETKCKLIKAKYRVALQQHLPFTVLKLN